MRSSTEYLPITYPPKVVFCTKSENIPPRFFTDAVSTASVACTSPALSAVSESSTASAALKAVKAVTAANMNLFISIYIFLTLICTSQKLFMLLAPQRNRKKSEERSLNALFNLQTSSLSSIADKARIKATLLFRAPETEITRARKKNCGRSEFCLRALGKLQPDQHTNQPTGILIHCKPA